MCRHRDVAARCVSMRWAKMRRIESRRYALTPIGPSLNPPPNYRRPTARGSRAQ
ncbi:hypothetical protein C8R44DRAFT_822821 [Mycena epipterygia]|nr:hypothetical protein C8R44DRAFT_822821 [Mycena epipterygia]